MMGLSHKIKRCDLRVGDHIYAWRKGFKYAHHGIYVDDDTVVHYGTGNDSILAPGASSGSKGPGGVLMTSLNEFLHGSSSLRRFEYGASPVAVMAKRGGTCTVAQSDPPETVIHRAMYLFREGFGNYKLLSRNCEAFAVYCKTGLVLCAPGLGGSAQVRAAAAAAAKTLDAPFLAAFVASLAMHVAPQEGMFPFLIVVVYLIWVGCYNAKKNLLHSVVATASKTYDAPSLSVWLSLLDHMPVIWKLPLSFQIVFMYLIGFGCYNARKYFLGIGPGGSDQVRAAAAKTLDAPSLFALVALLAMSLSWSPILDFLIGFMYLTSVGWNNVSKYLVDIAAKTFDKPSLSALVALFVMSGAEPPFSFLIVSIYLTWIERWNAIGESGQVRAAAADAKIFDAPSLPVLVASLAISVAPKPFDLLIVVFMFLTWVGWYSAAPANTFWPILVASLAISAAPPPFDFLIAITVLTWVGWYNAAAKTSLPILVASLAILVAPPLLDFLIAIMVLTWVGWYNASAKTFDVPSWSALVVSSAMYVAPRYDFQIVSMYVTWVGWYQKHLPVIGPGGISPQVRAAAAAAAKTFAAPSLLALVISMAISVAPQLFDLMIVIMFLTWIGWYIILNYLLDIGPGGSAQVRAAAALTFIAVP